MRMYSAQTQAVAVSAAQDIFQIEGAAGKLVFVKRVKVSATDTTEPTAQQISFEGLFMPATVTNGSGGSIPAVVKMDPGDAAGSAIVLANNTIVATTTGIATTNFSAAEHIANGLDLTFALPGESGIPAPVIGPSESFCLRLLSVVTGTVHMSATVWFAEIGG